MGFNAGSVDVKGTTNTYIRLNTQPTFANLSNATAIGANAVVGQNNSLILGSKGVRVGIGTSAPPAPLTVQADDNGSARGVPAQFQIQGDSDTRQQLLLGYFSAPGVEGYGTIQATDDNVANTPLMLNPLGGGVTVGTISLVSPTLTVGQGLGNPIADGWSTYSSRRWKTNIRTLPDALAKVEQLRGVSYDLKTTGKHEIGVIAEEVAAVVPEVVQWEKNGTDAQGVDYSRLTALLIEAIKQQQKKLEAQSADIRSLRLELRETRQGL